MRIATIEVVDYERTNGDGWLGPDGGYDDALDDLL